MSTYRYSPSEWRQARKHHRNQQKRHAANEYLERIKSALSGQNKCAN